MKGTPDTSKSKDEQDGEVIWGYAQQQIDYSIQQFVTSLVGLGALYFAYGTVQGQFIKTTIAGVGLLASCVLWMHSWVARVEALAAEQEVRVTNPKLVDRFKRLRSWRTVTGYGRFYQSITRLVIYFNAVLALSWGTVLLYGFGVPVGYLYALDLAAVVTAVYLGDYRRREDLRGSDKPFPTAPAWSQQDQPASTLLSVPAAAARSPTADVNDWCLFGKAVTLFIGVSVLLVAAGWVWFSESMIW